MTDKPCAFCEAYKSHCQADAISDQYQDAEEPKKCDTCKHVKEPWFNRCADCSDFELWEQICEK